MFAQNIVAKLYESPPARVSASEEVSAPAPLPTGGGLPPPAVRQEGPTQVSFATKSTFIPEASEFAPPQAADRIMRI